MEWLWLFEALSACRNIYDRILNLCVWNKDAGAMGAIYRYKHELVLVFKVGTAQHINNVGRGRHGPNRTNVWNYPDVTFRIGRVDELAMGLITVKPVALVADAIDDGSHHGGIVLDPFAGCGTTIIAAEKTGRRARCMEIVPRYADAAIRRWQIYTGKAAVLAGTKTTFEERGQAAALDQAQSKDQAND